MPDIEEILREMSNSMTPACVMSNRALIEKWVKSGITSISALVSKLKKHLGK